MGNEFEGGFGNQELNFKLGDELEGAFDKKKSIGKKTVRRSEVGGVGKGDRFYKSLFTGAIGNLLGGYEDATSIEELNKGTIREL